MLSKKIILPLLTILAVGVGLTFAPKANAQTTNPVSGFVQALSQKFGLDQNQVQSFVKDYKTSQAKNHNDNKLNNLVKQGKITDAQKQAILDEQAKLKSEYPPDSFKNLTQDQRKAQIQKMRDEINAWAKSQNIDPKYIMPGFGGIRFGMHKGLL